MSEDSPLDDEAFGIAYDGTPMYYDRQGQPIATLRRWAELMQDMDYKRVALDDIDLFHVSTVWLGLNHNFWPGGPPHIFETMVFLDGTPEDWAMWRYATEEQAIAGHKAAVEEIRQRTAEIESEEAAGFRALSRLRGGEAEPDALLTRREWLTMRAVACGAPLFTAVEAVATSAIAHPEWDMDELRTGAAWAEADEPSEK